MAKIDFATFCFQGDAHRLHAPGQFRRQVMSNCYDFNQLIVVYQKIQPANYPPLEDLGMPIIKPMIIGDMHINKILKSFGVDIEKKQYESSTDTHHQWKYHVVNHLCAASVSDADYIVFCDNDCWMLNPINWIDIAVKTFEDNTDCFIVSPNDGEPQRCALRMSQQMFMVRLDDFKNMDFNQPGWDGNVNVPGGPFPEYFSLLEGRMELYCRVVKKFRYVLSSEFRYWHFNRHNDKGLFQLDCSKY